MSNESNKVDVQGIYLLKEETVDADLRLDIENPETFSFYIVVYSRMYMAKSWEKPKSPAR
jgi:hypothetical protein